MTITNNATARWEGTLKEGNGRFSLGSGSLSDHPYSFATRFEGQGGSNPEELIAASHASCFSMAYSMVLGLSDLTAEAIETKATVTLEQVEGGFSVTKSHLETVVKCEGDETVIREAAETAKQNCPISKLLNAEITLDLNVQSARQAA